MGQILIYISYNSEVFKILHTDRRGLCDYQGGKRHFINGFVNKIAHERFINIMKDLLT